MNSKKVRYYVPEEITKRDPELKGKIVGMRIESNKGNQPVVYINGVFLNPAESLKEVSHSPDGFEWGFNGAGPAQLALAIAMEFLKTEYALELYNEFKNEVIVHLPEHEWAIEMFYVEQWFSDRLDAIHKKN